MIHRHRGNRRWMTYRKAKRKARIVHELNDYWYYPHFGQYRKGKIHCSCPRCAAKTNGKRPVNIYYGTNGRFENNYKWSDRKRMVAMAQDELDYSCVS